MQESRISFLLNELVREMNRQADSLLREEFDITYSQFAFLLKLTESGVTDVTRLAVALGVTKGAVSKRLGWFVNRGLVSTSQRENDAKRVMISITNSGSNLATKAGDYLESRLTLAITGSVGANLNALRLELQQMLAVLRGEKRINLPANR